MRDQLDASVLPGWAVDLLTNRAFNTVSAKFVIATELFIAVGLWSRRTRYAAIWVAICFHVAIQLSADVEVFSYLALAALVIWAVPSTRDRVLAIDPANPAHRRVAAATAGLDWLARFRIEAGAAGRPADRRRPRRQRASTAAAARFVASRLPADGVVRAARRSLVPGVRRRTDRMTTLPRRSRAVRRTGLVVAAVVTFGALAPPEHCPQPTVESLDSAADAAVQWFVATSVPTARGCTSTTGRPTAEVTSEPYNLVRHAGGDHGPVPGGDGRDPRRAGQRRPRRRRGPATASSTTTAGPRSPTARRRRSVAPPC